jgi:hypothetical protein
MSPRAMGNFVVRDGHESSVHPSLCIVALVDFSVV